MFDKDKPYALEYPGPFYVQNGVKYFHDGRPFKQGFFCTCGRDFTSDRGLKLHMKSCEAVNVEG